MVDDQREEVVAVEAVLIADPGDLMDHQKIYTCRVLEALLMHSGVRTPLWVMGNLSLVTVSFITL
jgi:hypothetical protein